MIRLSDGTKMMLAPGEIRNEMFQWGVRTALELLRSKSLGHREDCMYWQCGFAYRIGWWCCNSQFYGKGATVPFSEADIRMILKPVPEVEKWESD